MRNIVIETGVPLATLRGGKTRIARLDALRRLAKARVGASIYFARTYTNTVLSSCRAAAPGKWFTARQVKGGVRVWKIGAPESAHG